MPAPNPDLDAVRDIVRAALEIASFVEGLDLAAFLNDLRTQGAVLHRLIVVGEATKRLSSGFRSRHPELPWRQIAGMRDVYVHAYHRVELTRVWSIATEQNPALLLALVPLLDDADD